MSGPIASRTSAQLASTFAAPWPGSPQAASGRTLAISGGVGVLGALFLVGHQPGLAAAVLALLVWSAAAIELLRRKAYRDLGTAALSVTLVSMVAVRDAGWLVLLCLAAAALAGAVATTSARTAVQVVASVPGWLAGGGHAVRWLGRGVRARAETRRDQAVAAVRSVALTALLLGVFGALFASADTVFASYLPQPDLGLVPARLAVGVLLAVACATSALLAGTVPPWMHVQASPARRATRWEWLLPVASLDLLVLGFVLVQVSALFGGHRHVLETAGLTYAQYTRQGFAQLVAATALTLVVVAVAARRAPLAAARDRLIVRAALGTLCVATLGVVASALRRVDLYVEAFGLTRLRLLVITSELALGVLLVLVLVAGVRWRAAWLPRATVHLMGAAVLALAAINPDAQIVRHNAAAAAAGAPVDVGYLRGLSADAVPAMTALPEPLRSCLLPATARPPAGMADWNLGRARAARALSSSGHPDTGGSADPAWPAQCAEVAASAGR